MCYVIRLNWTEKRSRGDGGGVERDMEFFSHVLF